jgi:SAM-dependent methyltransferase
MQHLIDKVRDLRVSQEFASEDKMLGRDTPEALLHYFFVGRANLFTAYNVLNIRSGYCSSPTGPESILDYGCGYGRVTRWFRAAFPAARIDVTDLDQQAVDWCAAHLLCKPVGLALPLSAYDFIWVGSVFTHLSAHAAEVLLEQLLSALKPNGVLALTTHGRPAVMRMDDFDWDNDKRDWMHFRLGRERFEQAAAGYRASGYGYVDYPGHKDYGICIASGSWYSDRALLTNQIIQIHFQERSDMRQDVSAFMRANATESGLSPLYAGADKKQLGQAPPI